VDKIQNARFLGQRELEIEACGSVGWWSVFEPPLFRPKLNQTGKDWYGKGGYDKPKRKQAKGR